MELCSKLTLELTVGDALIAQVRFPSEQTRELLRPTLHIVAHLTMKTTVHENSRISS